MRVLFLSERLDRPEAHMIAGLQQAGLDVHARTSPHDPFLPFLLDHGVSAAALRLRGRLDLRAVRSIRQAILETRCDVMHALRNNRPVANALVAARGLPVKLVCYRGTMGNLHRWDPGSRLTYLSRRLDRIVCVSDAVRSYLLTLDIPRDRLVTIHKGHDPDWYRSAAPVDLAPLGIPQQAFVIGCTANMRPLKGVEFLVRALEFLPPDHPVHLLLIGEVRDPNLARLIQDERYRDRVHALGFRPDATTLIGACHVAAMPSLRREGLPRAIIEAMSQEVPAIVTRVGGMVELVDDGESGLVVPPADARALAGAMRRMFENDAERRRFGARALDVIRTRFHVDVTLARTQAMYRELISCGSAS